MKFATYSNDGGPNITGHYCPEIHPELFIKDPDGEYQPDPDGSIAGAVPITEEQWLLSIGKKLRIDPGTGVASEYVKTFTDQEVLETEKDSKISEILEAYGVVCSGSVICVVNDVAYTMNAGEEHANRMYNGCVLYERMGIDTITVTDFHNVDHENVPLGDGFAIAVQQGAHYAAARSVKNTLRTEVLNIKLSDYPSVDEAVAAIHQVSFTDTLQTIQGDRHEYVSEMRR
ncbi:MAG: hypothetical protein MI863_00365 [Desulfobacterales bacterium]|nr:hypothetical protein [Desulfobacterales bacterium]